MRINAIRKPIAMQYENNAKLTQSFKGISRESKELDWDEMNNRPVSPKISALVAAAKAIAAKIDNFKIKHGLSRADEREIMGAMCAFERNCDPITLVDHNSRYSEHNFPCCNSCA